MKYQMLWAVYVLIVVATVSYKDYKKRPIPNKLILPGIMFMIIYNLLKDDCFSIMVAFAITGTFLSFWVIEDNLFSGGDIQLICFVSLYAGSSIGVVLLNVMFIFLIIWFFLIFPIAKDTIQTQRKNLINVLKIIFNKRVTIPLAPVMFVSLLLFIARVGR